MNTARKLILISAALPLFAAPAVSFADASVAMNACVNAFVSANLPKEQKVRVKTLEPARSPIDIHGRAFKIVLNAKGLESGKQLANATCIVERDGTVIALNGKPLAPTMVDAKATLTSR